MMRLDEQDISIGFFVSRASRDRYHFDESLFAPNGKADIPTFHAARLFAQQMNRYRDVATYPELAVPAGQINAMALIHGISQHIFRMYCQQQGPDYLQKALTQLRDQLGPAAVDEALNRFIDAFPPKSIYRHEMGRDEYLAGTTGSRSNRELVLEELLMLWLSNANPAFSPYLELFDDDGLEFSTVYPQIISGLYQFFGQTIASGEARNNSV